MTNRQARALAAARRTHRMHNTGRADAYAAFMEAYESKPSQAHDVFGSVARREAQEKKDAAEIARPVMSAFTPAEGVYLNLRAYRKGVGQ